MRFHSAEKNWWLSRDGRLQDAHAKYRLTYPDTYPATAGHGRDYYNPPATTLCHTGNTLDPRRPQASALLQLCADPDKLARDFATKWSHTMRYKLPVIGISHLKNSEV